MKTFESSKTLYAKLSKKDKRKFNTMMGVVRRLTTVYNNSKELSARDKRNFEDAFRFFDKVRYSTLVCHKFQPSMRAFNKLSDIHATVSGIFIDDVFRYGNVCGFTNVKIR